MAGKKKTKNSFPEVSGKKKNTRQKAKRDDEDLNKCEERGQDVEPSHVNIHICPEGFACKGRMLCHQSECYISEEKQKICQNTLYKSLHNRDICETCGNTANKFHYRYKFTCRVRIKQIHFCQLCGKSFALKNTLCSHKMVHSKEKDNKSTSGVLSSSAKTTIHKGQPRSTISLRPRPYNITTRSKKYNRKSLPGTKTPATGKPTRKSLPANIIVPFGKVSKTTKKTKISLSQDSAASATPGKFSRKSLPSKMSKKTKELPSAKQTRNSFPFQYSRHYTIKEENICPGRTWQSMRNRWFTSIKFKVSDTPTTKTSTARAPAFTTKTSTARAPASTTKTSTARAPASTTKTSMARAPASATKTSITRALASTANTRMAKAPASTTKTSMARAPASTTKTSMTRALASTANTRMAKAPASTTKTNMARAPASTSKTRAPVFTTKTSTAKASTARTSMARAPAFTTKTSTTKAAASVAKTSTVRAPAPKTRTSTSSPTHGSKSQKKIKAPIYTNNTKKLFPDKVSIYRKLSKPASQNKISRTNQLSKPSLIVTQGKRVRASKIIKTPMLSKPARAKLLKSQDYTSSCSDTKEVEESANISSKVIGSTNNTIIEVEKVAIYPTTPKIETKSQNAKTPKVTKGSKPKLLKIPSSKINSTSEVTKIKKVLNPSKTPTTSKSSKRKDEIKNPFLETLAAKNKSRKSEPVLRRNINQMIINPRTIKERQLNNEILSDFDQDHSDDMFSCVLAPAGVSRLQLLDSPHSTSPILKTKSKTPLASLVNNFEGWSADTPSYLKSTVDEGKTPKQTQDSHFEHLAFVQKAVKNRRVQAIKRKSLFPQPRSRSLDSYVADLQPALKKIRSDSFDEHDPEDEKVEPYFEDDEKENDSRDIDSM